MIVAVRDHSIEPVADLLVREGLVTTDHILLHCSGAVSAREAFGKVASKVRGVATLHPLLAIADGRASANRFRDAVFGIQGSDPARAIAISLARALAGRPLVLNEGQMAGYHAAASLASNYVVTLLDVAAEFLAKNGIARSEALSALLTLAESSLQSVRERGVDGGLTGPIRRGDVDTIVRHLQALSPELQGLYRGLGRCTTAIARRLGDVSRADLEAIDSILDGVDLLDDSAAFSA